MRAKEEARADFAEGLKEFMRREGLTYRELSKRLNVSTTAILDWRNERTAPGLDKLSALMDMGMTIGEAFGHAFSRSFREKRLKPADGRAERFRATLLRACEAAGLAAGMVPPESGDSGILRAAIGEAQDKLGRAYALLTGEIWKESGGGGVSAGSASDAAGTVAPGGYGAELEKKEA